MKRYILFAYHAGLDMYANQPAGGWNDFIGDFDSIAACHAALNALSGLDENEDYSAHIVDTEIRKIIAIASGEREYDDIEASFVWTWKTSNTIAGVM